MCCVQLVCVCFGFSSPTERTETYLFTNCEHNLAIDPSPAPLSCHCDNVGAPATLPGQAPKFKIDFTYLEWSLGFNFFLLRIIANTSPLHTWLVATRSLYSGPEVLHLLQHLLILSFHCFSILQDQKQPGVWGEAVGCGLENTSGWICCRRRQTTCFKWFSVENGHIYFTLCKISYLLNWRGASRKDQST